MEEKIKASSGPVVREGTPNYKKLGAFRKSKRGKKVEKLLNQLLKQLFGKTAPENLKGTKNLLTTAEMFWVDWSSEAASGRVPGAGNAQEEMTMWDVFNDLLDPDYTTALATAENTALVLDFYAMCGGDLARHSRVDGYALIHQASNRVAHARAAAIKCTLGLFAVFHGILA